MLRRPDAFSGAIYLQKRALERQASSSGSGSGWVMPTGGDKVWAGEGCFACGQHFVVWDVVGQGAMHVCCMLCGTLPLPTCLHQPHSSCLRQAKRSAASFSSIGSMMRTGLGGLGLRSKSSPAVRWRGGAAAWGRGHCGSVWRLACIV